MDRPKAPNRRDLHDNDDDSDDSSSGVDFQKIKRRSASVHDEEAKTAQKKK